MPIGKESLVYLVIDQLRVSKGILMNRLIDLTSLATPSWLPVNVWCSIANATVLELRASLYYAVYSKCKNIVKNPMNVLFQTVTELIKSSMLASTDLKLSSWEMKYFAW